MQAPFAAACALPEVLEAAVAERNLPLQLAKCAFHVPVLWGSRCKASRESKATGKHYSAQPRRLGGAPGADARGDIALPLVAESAPASAPEHALRLSGKAVRLADAALEVLALAPSAPATQAMLALCRGVIARALDRDAGAPPCSAPLPRACILDQRALQVAAATFDAIPTGEMLRSLRLPVRRAGLGMPFHVVPFARVARSGGPGRPCARPRPAGGPRGRSPPAMAARARPWPKA